MLCCTGLMFDWSAVVSELCVCLYSVSPPLHLWVCPQLIFQPCFRFTERATEEEDLPNMGRSSVSLLAGEGFYLHPQENTSIKRSHTKYHAFSVFVFCYLIGENEWKKTQMLENDSGIQCYCTSLRYYYDFYNKNHNIIGCKISFNFNIFSFCFNISFGKLLVFLIICLYRFYLWKWEMLHWQLQQLKKKYIFCNILLQFDEKACRRSHLGEVFSSTLGKVHSVNHIFNISNVVFLWMH